MAVKKTKNTISPLFNKYNVLISGEVKSGKTTLFYETMLAKYGTTDAGAIIPFEQGYSHLNDALVLTTTDDNDNAKSFNDDFEDFLEIVDELIDNRFTDYKDVQAVLIDTGDRLFSLAEDYIVALSKRKGYDTTSINDAFGGWGVGHKNMKKAIYDAFTRLRNVGIGVWIAIHVKEKVIKKDKNDKEGKQTQAPLMGDNYFKTFSQDCDFMVYIDNNDKFDPTLKSTKKVHEIIFKQDGYSLAGSRFSAFLPVSVPFGAANFLNAFDNAMQQAMNLSAEEIAKRVQDEQIKSMQAAESFIEKDKNQRVENEIQDVLQQFNMEMQTFDNTIREVLLNKIKELKVDCIENMIRTLGISQSKVILEKCIAQNKKIEMAKINS